MRKALRSCVPRRRSGCSLPQCPPPPPWPFTGMAQLRRRYCFGNANSAARSLGHYHGTGDIVPFVNRTFEWGLVIATLLSVLSIVPHHCVRLTYFLHRKLRELRKISAVLIAPQLKYPHPEAPAARSKHSFWLCVHPCTLTIGRSLSNVPFPPLAVAGGFSASRMATDCDLGNQNAAVWGGRFEMYAIGLRADDALLGGGPPGLCRRVARLSEHRTADHKAPRSSPSGDTATNTEPSETQGCSL